MSVRTKLGWSVCLLGILLVYLPFGLTRAPADGFLHLFITDPSLLQRWTVTGLGFVVVLAGVIIAGKAYQKRDGSRRR